MCFPTCVREGLKPCGWLNNENGLRGNEELCLSIITVMCLFSPLVRPGTTDSIDVNRQKGREILSRTSLWIDLFYRQLLFLLMLYQKTYRS